MTLRTTVKKKEKKVWSGCLDKNRGIFHLWQKARKSKLNEIRDREERRLTRPLRGYLVRIKTKYDCVNLHCDL